MNEKKGFIIQEPSVIEETEKMFKAYYEYKSKEGILIGLLGNLEIQEIKIPIEVKDQEDFEEILKNAINEAVIYVTKSTQNELFEMIANMED